jgi:uncharacterized membrane protein YbhN (UPF0104 family)
MKPMLRWAGTALAIVASIAFIGYVFSTLQVSDLKSHLSASTAIAIIASTLVYTLIIPISAVAWKLMLADMGRDTRFAPLATILFVTQAGKYLPGNVGQHISRFGLAVMHGVPPPLLVASMTYEVVLLLVANLLTASVCGAASQVGLQLLVQGHENRVWVVALGAAGALSALVVLSHHLPRWVAFLARRRAIDTNLPGPISFVTMSGVIALYVVAMLCVGGAISVLAYALFPGMHVDFALLTAAFTLAWAVGFVTPGAPAGLGVREALLLVLLAPTMGAANASLLSIALRVVTTLGDIVCFVVGLLLLPAFKRVEPLSIRDEST